ncbi:hypothetical protein AcV7_004596 [Taiwanofungus camphoratus]|nr:hypothetical protein AcV7_004596 [Antrodia cinnamomea]
MVMHVLSDIGSTWITAIYALWNWGWTFSRVNINTCQVGFYLTTGSSPSQGAGAEAIIDVTVTNTPVFVQTSAASNGSLDGSIVLNNIQLNNVPTAVGVANGDVVLEGGSFTIDSWAQGNTYSGTSASGTFVQADISSISKPSSVLDSSGYIFGKTHPQYAEYSSSQFMSVKSQGAKGDGYTDDTEAIQNVFNQYAGCYIIFFDAGTYIVTSTITIPAGTQVVGEAWSTIMANGSYFQDYNHPQVVVRVGEPQSEGVAEITDMIFTARGPAAGAIIVEWNVHDPSGQQGAAGTWDTHIILGGSACYLLSQRASLEHVLVESGSNLQASQCPTSDTSNNNCFAAFLALHITQYASAYLEGLWVWLADHDLDSSDGTQVNLWSGRGIYSESQGPVWLIGTGNKLSEKCCRLCCCD